MKKPKIRVPIAPPSQRHKSKKDYDRKLVKKVIAKIIKDNKETLDRLDD